MSKQPEQPPSKPTVSSENLLWPWAAIQSAVDSSFWWLDHRCERDDAELPWTTSNKIALELASMRLRDFSRTRAGNSALVCAPYALHSALIADFAPHHSIVEALQSHGLPHRICGSCQSTATSPTSM